MCLLYSIGKRKIKIEGEIELIKKSYITVKSCWGHEINHLLLSHEPKSDSLVILFPGAGYSCDKPLLYYAREVTLLLGCDVLSLEYGYFKTNEGFKPEFIQLILMETQEAIQECLAKQYKKIYFISKSLGTSVAGEISKVIGYDKVENLFLTPIKYTIPHIMNSKCTVIVGDQDKLFPKESIDEIRKYELVDTHVISEATYSLETEESYRRSLEILDTVAMLYEKFIGTE